MKAMGHDGLDRALWEYKAGSAKKSVWGQRAYMSYGSDSYIGQLHASLDELLDPLVVQACKRTLQRPKDVGPRATGRTVLDANPLESFT